jgi:hypothetical protein
MRRLGEPPAPRSLLSPNLVSLGAAALLLAACQVPPSSSQATAKSVAQPALAQNQVQEPAAATFQTPDPSAPKPTMLAATPAVAHGVDGVGAPVAPLLHLSGDPKELVGLDHTVVRRALGDPQHIRNEMPAQVWQYATGDCVVDLYLYDQDGAWTVTYVEARSHTAESAPTARCLRSLLERPTASAG